MVKIIVDVRDIPESCSSHPAIALSQKLNSLGKDVDSIEVLYRPQDIPDPVVSLFLIKYGFRITESSALNDNSRKVVAVRDIV